MIPIKKDIDSQKQKKEKVRMIESNDKRIVHFLFDPKLPVEESPFVRKYQKLLDGTMEEFENEEREKF